MRIHAQGLELEARGGAFTNFVGGGEYSLRFSARRSPPRVGRARDGGRCGRWWAFRTRPWAELRLGVGGSVTGEGGGRQEMGESGGLLE